MTVVYVPQQAHACDLSAFKDDRPGTTRRCDCGKFWVWQVKAESRADELTYLLFPCWRPEKRRERRRRERADREARTAPPPSVPRLEAPPAYGAGLRPGPIARMFMPAPGAEAGSDVHVDWHMTPAEWEQLRDALADSEAPYIQRLRAEGKLGD